MANTVCDESTLLTAFANLPRKGVTAQNCRDLIVSMFDEATMQGVVGNADFPPTADSTYDIGSDAVRWAVIYGDTLDCPAVGSHLIPNLDDTYDLGATGGFEWANLYIDNIIVTGEVTGALTPVATDTHDLGTTAKRWKDGYFSGDVAIAGSLNAGSGNTVTGSSSGAVGAGCEVSGNYSFATGYTTTASGGYSFATGRTTTASGLCSFATGHTTAASGNYSFATGSESLADKQMQSVYGGGKFTVTGDAQISVLVARASVLHENSDWHDLLLNATDKINMLVNDTAWNFDIKIVGTTAGVGKAFAFNIVGLVKNDSGTNSILAQTVTTLYDTDDTDFDAQVAIDGADTDAFLIQVKDSTSGSDTVRWVARVELTEVSFPAA